MQQRSRREAFFILKDAYLAEDDIPERLRP